MKTLRNRKVIDEFDFAVVSRNGYRMNTSRSVLAAKSRVWAAMLGNKSWRETQRNELVLDLDKPCLSKLVKSLHGQDISLNLEQARTLLLLADMYELKELKRQCHRALKDCLNYGNVVQVAKLSLMANADKLAMHCYVFISKGLKDPKIKYKLRLELRSEPALSRECRKTLERLKVYNDLVVKVRRMEGRIARLQHQTRMLKFRILEVRLTGL